MILSSSNDSYFKNSLLYLTKEKKSSIELYLAVRKKENRILSNEQVLLLPHVTGNNPYFSEWHTRKKSADRFLDYLNLKKEITTILDIGCGNGWFTNLIATHFPTINVIGLDVNEHELIQANKIFQRDNLEFVFADIFKLNPQIFNRPIDLIVLNASVQYFPDLKILFSTLKTFLRSSGELHIMDSPFYKEKHIKSARQRTQNYYTKLGFPEMAEHYFHHSLKDLNDFEILYQPKNTVLSKVFKKMNSPFLWVKKQYENQ